MNLVNDLARHESPCGSVVKVSNRCVEGHEFDSRQDSDCFLCPMLMTN